MNCTLGEWKDLKIETPAGMTELVRGKDTLLMAQVEPLVRETNVALDLRSVNRIDAAGIAALIALYGVAHEAGHEFSVCNVSGRVQEILALVGLEPILVSHDAVPVSHAGHEFQRTAA